MPADDVRACRNRSSIRREPTARGRVSGTLCSKRWGHRCANAKSRKCRCACGGSNHGKSNPLSLVHQPTARERAKREQTNMFRELDARRNPDELFYPPGHPPRRQELERLERPDSRSIQFGRNDRGPTIWLYVPETSDVKSHVTPLEQRIVYHSPTG